MKITFGFSKNTSCQPFSVAIRLVEKRDYSHVYMKIVDETTNEVMIYQASHGFVNIVPLERFLEHSIICEEYELEVDDTKYIQVKKEMNSYLGLSYGFAQILNIFVQKLFQSKNIKLVENGKKQFICSELGYIILKILFPEIIADEDSVTPSDFNVLIKKCLLKGKNV